MRSGAELSRAVGRLDEVLVLTLGLPTIDHVPPGRVTALARFATVARAQAVARMPLEPVRFGTLRPAVHKDAVAGERSLKGCHPSRHSSSGAVAGGPQERSDRQCLDTPEPCLRGEAPPARSCLHSIGAVHILCVVCAGEADVRSGARHDAHGFRVPG